MEHFAHFFQSHLFIPKDVTLPDPSFIRCTDAPVCKIPHITKIEGAAHAYRHFAVHDLDDCSCCLTDSVIFRSQDTAGVYHTGLKSSNSIPEYRTDNYLIFTPLCSVDSETKEALDGVIFLVNADQLSGLVTLSNFDRKSIDNTSVTFGGGCAQSILFPFSAENTNQKCFIGLTDPSARKCISGEILSFSIPWARFKEMKNVAEESFLTKETWGTIAKRL